MIYSQFGISYISIPDIVFSLLFKYLIAYIAFSGAALFVNILINNLAVYTQANIMGLLLGQPIAGAIYLSIFYFGIMLLTFLIDGIIIAIKKIYTHFENKYKTQLAAPSSNYYATPFSDHYDSI